jgi:hypothetical protein
VVAVRNLKLLLSLSAVATWIFRNCDKRNT